MFCVCCLFTRCRPFGVDLYSGDRALYQSDEALYSGPNLWASDQTLYATAEDLARAKLEALKQWLSLTAYSPRVDSDDDKFDQACCAICLASLANHGQGGNGNMSARRTQLVDMACGHCYHLECILKCIDFPGGDLCPTCRRPLRSTGKLSNGNEGVIERPP